MKRLIFYISIILCLFFEVVSIWAESKDIKKILDKGDYYYSLGNYNKALKYYKNIIEQKNIDNIYTSKYLYTLLLLKKDSIYLKYVEEKLDGLDSLYFLSLLWIKQSKYKNITQLELLSDSNSINSYTFAKLLFLKIEAYRMLNRNSEAIKLAKEYVKLYPFSIESIRLCQYFPVLTEIKKAKTDKQLIISKKTNKRKIYYIYQFGMFAKQENAQRFLVYLVSKYPGIKFYIREKKRNGKKVYIVTSKRFKSKKEAKKYYDKVLSKKIKEKMFLTFYYE